MRVRLSLLLIVLFGAFSAIAEGPLVLPIGKMGDSELSTVLPSEKSLIIVGILAQIIWNLLTYLYKRKEKEADKSQQKLDRLYDMVHKMQGQITELGEAPTEDQIFVRLQPHIELAVIKAIRNNEDKRNAR